MVRTAANVYSFRALDDTVEEMVERVAEAGYDGIQFSGSHTPLEGEPESIARTLEAVDLDVVPPHVGLDALTENREAVLEAYGTVGVDVAVIPYLPAERFESAAAVEETARELSELADELADDGWELHYHNHDHEYVELADGRWAFERFIEEADVGIELDVGWALLGGDDPETRIERLGDRVDLLHLKDMDADDRSFREIGEGDVDMEACAAAAREAGTEWLIYEHDEPADPARSVRVGAAFLEELEGTG